MRIKSGLLIAVLLLTSFASAQVFRLTDLGTTLFPRVINNSGQAAGFALVSSGYVAVLWSKRGGLKYLGTLPGAMSGSPYGINNHGDVVGASFTSDNKTVHAILWHHQGKVQDLGVLTGTYSVATGINDDGTVVGADGLKSFVWTAKSGMNDLSVFGFSSNATAIDSDGAIVGNSLANDSADPTSTPWIWTKATGVQAINSLGFAQIWAIRNGYGVGSYCTPDCQSGPFSGPNGFIWRAHFGRTTVCTQCTAWGINRYQQVVGSHDDGRPPFLWKSGVEYNLQDLVDAPGWILSSANGINDKGQIIGEGLLNGEAHGYLLTVIPARRENDEDEQESEQESK